MTKGCIRLINEHYNTPGVYCLTHEVTGERYVGSSVNIGMRVWGGILSYNNLVANKNLALLKLSILEITPDKNIKELRVLEEKWIEKLNTYYPNGMNVSSPRNHFDQKFKAKKVPVLTLMRKYNEKLKDELFKYRICCSASSNDKIIKRKKPNPKLKLLQKELLRIQKPI